MLTQIRNFVVFAFSHQLWKRQLLLVYFGQSNIFQHMHMFSLPTYIHICIFCILGPRWRTLDRVARVNFRREHLVISQRPNRPSRCLDFAVLPLETAVSACLLRVKQTVQVPLSNSSPGRARRTSPCPVCKFMISRQLLFYLQIWSGAEYPQIRNSPFAKNIVRKVGIPSYLPNPQLFFDKQSCVFLSLSNILCHFWSLLGLFDHYFWPFLENFLLLSS